MIPRLQSTVKVMNPGFGMMRLRVTRWEFSAKTWQQNVPTEKGVLHGSFESEKQDITRPIFSLAPSKASFNG